MNIVKEFRSDYGFTQKKLGELIGFSQQHIKDMEAGRKSIMPHVEISLNNLDKILKLEREKQQRLLF